MRILVVDDEPDAIELIRFNLKASGYEVLTAEDGEEALAKARKFSPDMILLDVMLPEIDGLEVCKILNLKRKKWWAKVDSNHRPHAYQACALTS